MNDQKQAVEQKGVAMSIFAILGFVAILLAGLWATIQLVQHFSNTTFEFTTPSFLTSDTLELNNDGILATSGEPTDITWSVSKGMASDAGATINLSYVCKKGLYLKIKTAVSTEFKVIPCNAKYTVPVTDKKIAVIPVLSGTDNAELVYSLTYSPAEGSNYKEQSVRGTMQITGKKLVLNTQNTSNEQTTQSNTGTQKPATNSNISMQIKGSRSEVKSNKNTTTHYKTIRKTVPVRKSNPNGLPDLTVKVLSAKISGGIATVRLEVSNMGTKLAKNWTLTATLPTNPPYTYASEPQTALYAGERAELILRFNNIKPGDLIITVDANNVIKESLETNNSVTVQIK